MNLNIVLGVGPMVFVYRGIDGNPTSAIELDMTLPVQESSYEGNFDYMELPAVEVVEKAFLGTAADIGPKGWEPFMGEIMQSGITPTGVCREIMTDWVGRESEQNKIMMQMVLG